MSDLSYYRLGQAYPRRELREPYPNISNVRRNNNDSLIAAISIVTLQVSDIGTMFSPALNKPHFATIANRPHFTITRD